MGGESIGVNAWERYTADNFLLTNYLTVDFDFVLETDYLKFAPVVKENSFYREIRFSPYDWRFLSNISPSLKSLFNFDVQDLKKNVLVNKDELKINATNQPVDLQTDQIIQNRYITKQSHCIDQACILQTFAEKDQLPNNERGPARSSDPRSFFGFGFTFGQ